MEINQAFEILSRASNIHDTRIIVENIKHFSPLKVWRIKRNLRKGVPVAKIINQKWFYGLKFYTNKYTLDPRPDTETLVYAVISDYADNDELKILDLGTGTGCIITAIVKNLSNATGVGVDISRKAVNVARKNVTDLRVDDKITIKKKNFNKRISFNEKFDVIVSNPPYIKSGDFRVNLGAKYDPKIALYARKNGLSAYEKIAKNARNWIKTGGKIYLEIGVGQTSKVKNIFIKTGWSFERAEKDLSGINRVLVFKK